MLGANNTLHRPPITIPERNYRVCYFAPTNLHVFSNSRTCNPTHQIQLIIKSKICKPTFLMVFTLIDNLMLSKDLMDQTSKERAGFSCHTIKVIESAEKLDVADFLSILKWFEPRIRQKTVCCMLGKHFKLIAWDFLSWSLIISSLTLLLLWRWRRRPNHLPPGPPGWPVFGHMFHLGTMPHHTLTKLRDKYGPVLWLKLGSANTMVVLNAAAATELFKNHDLAFIDRYTIDLMRVQDYHKGSLALASHGTHWRTLRRICTTEMLTARRITDTAPVRRKCVDSMLSRIEKTACQQDQTSIHVARFVFLMAFNMIGNLMLSRDVMDPESEVESEFFRAMTGMMEWTGHPNIADLFPWLGWFDLQGLRRRMKRDMGKALEIASGYVKERVKGTKAGEKKRQDFLDVLLDFEESGKDESARISDHNLNIFILEMFLAGSETTSSTTEWALTELLCHPEAMAKVHKELSELVGENRKMEETDIENLPYLQAVVKENLRLHPPIPFLVPRKAVQNTQFMGYQIPKDTQVFVNTWAIGRDPECWEDPWAFKPERFLGSKVDYKGQNYEFIPFGAGRRICAGLLLGQRTLQLVLGSLLHEFEWRLVDGATPERMDRKERMGVTVRKFEPLRAVPRRTKGYKI
ncbi:hypothetical protein NMG60_11008370 [Bertholletia excelsa]